jgi:hypothetical protein
METEKFIKLERENMIKLEREKELVRVQQKEKELALERSRVQQKEKELALERSRVQQKEKEGLPLIQENDAMLTAFKEKSLAHVDAMREKFRRFTRTRRPSAQVDSNAKVDSTAVNRTLKKSNKIQDWDGDVEKVKDELLQTRPMPKPKPKPKPKAKAQEKFRRFTRTQRPTTHADPIKMYDWRDAVPQHNNLIGELQRKRLDMFHNKTLKRYNSAQEGKKNLTINLEDVMNKVLENDERGSAAREKFRAYARRPPQTPEVDADPIVMYDWTDALEQNSDPLRAEQRLQLDMFHNKVKQSVGENGENGEIGEGQIAIEIVVHLPVRYRKHQK